MRVKKTKLPQMWQIKKLGESAKIINGGTPKTKIKKYWNGEIAWITPADMGKLEKIYVEETSRTITDLGLEKSSAKLFPPSSVILSTRAPIGHLAINTVPMSTNQGCRAVIPLKELDYKYLFYFLKSNINLLNKLGTGTTFKELSSKNLKDVEIPLPPLPEQKQIVSILQEAFWHDRSGDSKLRTQYPKRRGTLSVQAGWGIYESGRRLGEKGIGGYFGNNVWVYC